MMAADQSIHQALGPPKKLELTTKNIAHNAGVSRPYVSERLAVLVNHGLGRENSAGRFEPILLDNRKG